jgi:hypothetical protein
MKNKCIFYTISRLQRQQELERGLDESYTQGYQERGCYDCDGFKFDCEAYQEDNRE